MSHLLAIGTHIPVFRSILACLGGNRLPWFELREFKQFLIPTTFSLPQCFVFNGKGGRSVSNCLDPDLLLVHLEALPLGC